MKFELTINCDNAAFHAEDGNFDPQALAFTLGVVVSAIECGLSPSRPIFDINGNRVGWASLTVNDKEHP